VRWDAARDPALNGMSHREVVAVAVDGDVYVSLFINSYDVINDQNHLDI
jgi:hypothetical protein